MHRARAGLCAALFCLAHPVAAQDSWALPDDQAFLSVKQFFPGTGTVTARLSGATDRYEHGVLGGIPMFSRLTVSATDETSVDLPADLVFEDTAPRIWDVDGDGEPEVVLVEAHRQLGARLAVWGFGPDGLTRRASTAFIGSPQRWLAPAGIGDFDSDGQVEMAYVDRPHLARELVFVQIRGRKLVEIARIPGFSNHQIGDTTIQSGARNCGDGDELVLPDADHSRLIAYRLGTGGTDLERFHPAALAAALTCRVDQ